MGGVIVLTLVFSVVLAALGTGLAVGMKAEIAQRRRARDWPTTQGTVVSALVKDSVRFSMRARACLPVPTHTIITFEPIITTTYEVDGKSYTTTRYRNGLITGDKCWGSLGPKPAQRIVAAHPPQTPVTVFYNPEAPAQAYLDLNLSEGMLKARRAAGLVLLAAAAGLLLLGAFRVGQEVVRQNQQSEIPASIPTSTEELKAALSAELSMACKGDPFLGGSIPYTAWECEAAHGDSTAFVTIYSRQRAPDAIDAVRALTGASDPQQKLDFYVRVASLAIPTLNTQDARAWLAETEPTLGQQGSSAETVWSGVKALLANPHGLGTSLTIGETK